MNRFIMMAAFVAALTGPAAAADPGEAEFTGACAKCHTVEKAVTLMKRQPDSAKRRPWLDNHLKGHFAPDPALRTAIVRFLEKRLTAAK